MSGTHDRSPVEIILAERDRLLSERDTRYQGQFKALEQLVDARFEAAEKLVNASMIAAEKAIDKAEASAERRFESVNEFRSSLSDQASRLISRSEADARFNAVGDKLSDMSGLVRREEHQLLADALNKLELEQRGTTAVMVQRADLEKLDTAIGHLREVNSATSAKTLALSQVATFALAVLSILVSLAGFYHSTPSVPVGLAANSPNVGADTKRVDDLIAQSLERNRDIIARINALSARMNAGQGTSPPAAASP